MQIISEGKNIQRELHSKIKITFSLSEAGRYYEAKVHGGLIYLLTIINRLLTVDRLLFHNYPFSGFLL